MRMVQAVLASLLIHLLIILFLFYKNQFTIKPTQNDGKKELLLANFQATNSSPQKTIQEIQNEPIPPKKQEKIQNKPKLPIKQEKIQKIEPQKKITKTTPVQPNFKASSPLANALLKESKSYKSQKPTVDQKIRNLYGATFDKFTPTQKKFIEDNLDKIHQITQMTLTQNGYPEVALQTMQQGVNVVSFDFHPNGDITNLQLIKKMGYAILDRNTIEVIKIAYKNYPKPKTTTKIIFNMEYRISPY
jgi:TonB family protein